MSIERLLSALRRELRRALKIDVVRTANTATLTYHLEDMLRAYRIDTIIDVGASVGQFAMAMRDLGFKGDIHSFEPIKQTYARLASAAASDDRWTTHNMALGSKPGTLLMNVAEGSVFSSALAPNSFGSARFEGMKVQRQEEVEVSTLDYFIEHHLDGGNRRIFLKMDTQGFDLEVFAGAAASLERICCVLSELSLIPIYEGMTDYLRALSTYREKGFSVSGWYSVNRNDDLSLIEVDCMMVNRARF